MKIIDFLLKPVRNLTIGLFMLIFLIHMYIIFFLFLVHNGGPFILLILTIVLIGFYIKLARELYSEELFCRAIENPDKTDKELDEEAGILTKNLKTRVIPFEEKENSGLLTKFTNTVHLKSFDINSLIKISVSAEGFDNKEYFANLSRALVKTLRKYCTKEFFKPEYVVSSDNHLNQPAYKEHNLQILLLNYKKDNLYGFLFNLITDKLKINTDSFTNEIVLSEDSYQIIPKEIPENQKNCILISYSLKNKKVYFLEKSRGNINKNYLLSYLRRL